MEAKKPHSTKKKWLVYLALGFLSLFLVHTFRVEIGNVFHAVSHILTGSDYTHTHNIEDESYNKSTPNGDQHDHKLLAFLHLLDHTKEMPIHRNEKNSIRVNIPEYALLDFKRAGFDKKKETRCTKVKKHGYPSIHLDVLTPPPKNSLI